MPVRLRYDAQDIMTIGIYEILNIDTGIRYIGSSFDIEDRIKGHFKKLNRNNHSNKHLQNSYNIHGKNKFAVTILEIVTFIDEDIATKDKILRGKEQCYINKYNFDLLYNQCPVAGSTKGRKHSQETKTKISASNTGKPSWLKGKKLSEEHKKNLSCNKKGRTNKLKGTETLNGRKAIVQIDRYTKQEIKEFNSAKEANKATGIHVTDISKCCHGKLKQAGNFIWKFKI